MSGLRKNAIKPVEYESNPINPLGLSCMLLKCRDLYTLSISSISVFYEIFTNQENLTRLNANFPKLAKRILDIPSCAWLLLMIYAAPHALTLKVLEELVGVFSTARKLPKGLNIRGTRGKAHLSPDDANSIAIASREAIRLTLILSSKVNKSPLESRSPIWLLGLKLLMDDDLQQCVLAANSLLYELEINNKRLIIANELHIMIACLKSRVKKFYFFYKELTKYSKLLKVETREYFEKKKHFTEILFEITHMEHEHELDVPLEYYLKDHDDLRRAHEARMKAKQSLENTNQLFKQTKGNYDLSFACLRLLCLLISRALVLYTGLYLDTTSLLSLEPDSTVPSTHSLSSNINPLIFGGYTSEGNLKNKIQKEELISNLITEIPWRELTSLLCIERIVAGTCSIRLLGAVVCKFSDVLQWKLLPWCRRALEDLLHQPRWYPVTEAIPIFDAPPPQSKRELFRSLSVEEPPPPKAIYFNRLMSLDSRISCALVYWTTRGNTHILNQCSQWMDTTAYQQDKENNLIHDKRIKGEVNPKYLVWVQLLRHSDKKSELIENETEYYATIDPSRRFREMELKSLATTELIINEEFDEGELSDESESEDGDDEDDDEDNGDSDEDCEDGQTANTDSKIPQRRKIKLKPTHKKIFQQMLDDRYAMALLHLTASEYFDDTTIPTDFNLYEDCQKICQDLSVCSKFIHDELSPHINNLLLFALEGPSDQESFRYSHPYQIISSLLQQDTSIGLSQILCQEIPVSLIQFLITNSLSIQNGIIDNIFRSNAISLLSHLFGGMGCSCFSPSLAPMHQHTLQQTLLSRQSRESQNENEEKMTPLKLYSQCKIQISCLIEHICETIYKTRRDDLLPCGDTGRCYLSRIVNLLTIFTDLDDIFVWTSLLEAFEKRNAEEEKIKFWPSTCPVSSDDLWLAPFILLFQGGTSKLISVYRRTMDWKIPKVDEESYGNSAYRGYYDVCRQFSALLAVLSTVNQSVALTIAQNATLIVPALISSIKAKDRILNQYIYRISTSIIASATISFNSTSKCVPFDAPATYFRLLFFQEGNGLDIACEMTREVYCDLWGMDEPPPTIPSPQHIPSTRPTQSLPPLVSNKQLSSKDQQVNIRRGSDRRFPQLGVKSGSMKNLQIEQKSNSSEEKMNLPDNALKSDSSLQRGVHGAREDAGPGHQLENEQEDEGERGEAEEKDDEEEGDMLLEESSQPNEDEDQASGENDDEDGEEDEEEDKDPDEMSAIGVITEWVDRLRYEKMRIARDFILYTFECLVTICENRLELQDRIANKSPFFFQALYGILTPTTPNSIRTAAVLNDDDSVSIGEYPSHLGVTGSCAQVLRTLVKRHDRIRSLIRSTSCIEGLIDALDVSYVINDNVLGLYIVITIEQLIIRNLEIWSFVKRAGGVKGLLQLCHMGNVAVRVLACNDLITQISSIKQEDGNAIKIIEETLKHNGLLTILVMLHSQDPSVQTNSLILLKTLCTHQLACRRAILSSTKFISELGSLLFSPDLSVIRVACEMMMILGAEDQFTLRQLIEAMESTIQHVATIYGKKIIFRFGKNYTIDEEEDLNGLSIKSRLIDIANGILSTQSISETAFSISKQKNIQNNFDPLYDSRDIHEQLLSPIAPSKERNISYTTEYISKEGRYYEEPRYIQDIKYLANLAANVLAAMTDAEEGNWPDGGAPLRQTMKVAGILPNIHDNSGRRRHSDNNILQYKS